MGELGDQLVDAMVASGLATVVNDTLENARILGTLVQLIVTEESKAANPQQVTEAAARCIDVIEILIEAVADAHKSELTDARGLRAMNRELREVRKALDTIKRDILHIGEDD
jgi:hypothetical protein